MTAERFMEILNGILDGGSPSVVGGDDIFIVALIYLVYGGVLLLIMSIFVVMTLPLFIDKDEKNGD